MLLVFGLHLSILMSVISNSTTRYGTISMFDKKLNVDCCFVNSKKVLRERGRLKKLLSRV